MDTKSKGVFNAMIWWIKHDQTHLIMDLIGQEMYDAWWPVWWWSAPSCPTVAACILHGLQHMSTYNRLPLLHPSNKVTTAIQNVNVQEIQYLAPCACMAVVHWVSPTCMASTFPSAAALRIHAELSLDSGEKWYWSCREKVLVEKCGRFNPRSIS